MIKQLIFLCLLTFAIQGSAQHHFIETARQTLQWLNNRNFDSLEAIVEVKSKKALSAERMEFIWDDFTEKYDSLITINETKIEANDSLYVTETLIAFKKKEFNYKVTFNKNKQIVGLFFLNTKLQYEPPSYVNSLAFVEYKIAVPVKNIQSNGVLSLPRNVTKPPLVIIVGGSGPTDADGTFGPNKMYKDLAWGLASSGIAAYRYDKRTANPLNIKRTATFGIKDEYIEDIEAIIKLFKADNRINSKQIWLLGHSQGGYVIPSISKHIKGYILMAASNRNIPEMIVEQCDYLLSSTKEPNAERAYTQLRSKAIYTNKITSVNKVYNDSLIDGVTAYYIISERKLNPVPFIRKNKKPLLVIQGARDYQVTTKDLDRWREVIPSSTPNEIKVYENLNHLFMSGKGLSKPDEYLKLNHIEQQVIIDITTFIKTH